MFFDAHNQRSYRYQSFPCLKVSEIPGQIQASFERMNWAGCSNPGLKNWMPHFAYQVLAALLSWQSVALFEDKNPKHLPDKACITSSRGLELLIVQSYEQSDEVSDKGPFLARKKAGHFGCLDSIFCFFVLVVLTLNHVPYANFQICMHESILHFYYFYSLVKTMAPIQRRFVRRLSLVQMAAIYNRVYTRYFAFANDMCSKSRCQFIS